MPKCQRIISKTSPNRLHQGGQAYSPQAESSLCIWDIWLATLLGDLPRAAAWVRPMVLEPHSTSVKKPAILAAKHLSQSSSTGAPAVLQEEAWHPTCFHAKCLQCWASSCWVLDWLEQVLAGSSTEGGPVGPICIICLACGLVPHHYSGPQGQTNLTPLP